MTDKQILKLIRKLLLNPKEAKKFIRGKKMFYIAFNTATEFNIDFYNTFKNKFYIGVMQELVILNDKEKIKYFKKFLIK